MASVIGRHYPSLAPVLRGVDNAFLPWSPVTADDTGEAVAESAIPEGWRLRRGVWNLMVRFKFQRGQAVRRAPSTSDEPPLDAVPFSQGFPDIPIARPRRRRPRAPGRVRPSGHAGSCGSRRGSHRVFPPRRRGPAIHRRQSRQGTRRRLSGAPAPVPAAVAASGVRRPRPRSRRRGQSVRVSTSSADAGGQHRVGPDRSSSASSATPGSVHRPPASSSSSTSVPVGSAP